MLLECKILGRRRREQQPECMSHVCGSVKESKGEKKQEDDIWSETVGASRCVDEMSYNSDVWLCSPFCTLCYGVAVGACVIWSGSWCLILVAVGVCYMEWQLVRVSA